MNTLEYFMAHAPAEPQAWFDPVMETERPKFTDPRLFKQPDHEVNEIAYWDKERYKETYLQWPLAWAQEMMKRIPVYPDAQRVAAQTDWKGFLESQGMLQTKSAHYNQAEHGSEINEEPRFEDLLKFVVDQKNLPSNSPYNKSMFGWLENALLDVKNFLGRP
jgi:hypothetical protein